MCSTRPAKWPRAPSGSVRNCTTKARRGDKENPSGLSGAVPCRVWCDALTDCPFFVAIASAYASPPLNARRTAFSWRGVCVEFALSFRYKSGGEPKECRVPSETFILFPPFRLDVRNEQLWRDNELVTVRPKSFAVLAYLAMHPGRLVTAAELRQAVWPQTYV